MTTTDFAALAQHLRAKAIALARARIVARRTDPVRHWRKPALLWPLFSKG